MTSNVATEGAWLGCATELVEGGTVGSGAGSVEGPSVGRCEGLVDGARDGARDGLDMGADVGVGTGAFVGLLLGCRLGFEVTFLHELLGTAGLRAADPFLRTPFRCRLSFSNSSFPESFPSKAKKFLFMGSPPSISN